MVTQSVPVPAVVAAELARAARDNIDRLEERGCRNIAEKVRQYSAVLLFQSSMADGGEFISVSAPALQTVTAHRSYNPKGEYAQCARHFLEQYNVW